jgi:excisionase family DNA binding protein
MKDAHELLLISEVAAACRVSVATVRYWIQRGRLPSVRPGRRRMVRREDLAALLAATGSPAIAAGARGLTHRGGNPGRLTPTADPSGESTEKSVHACGKGDPSNAYIHEPYIPAHRGESGRPNALPWSKEGVDRPGLAGGESRSDEGAQHPGPGAQGTPRSGARARIREDLS